MYHRVGTYAGRVPLQELVAQLAALEVAWAPDGHGTIIEQLELVSDSFRASLADVFPGESVYSMAVLLKSNGGAITFHTDPPRRNDVERRHLVMQTNSRCWNYHDGAWQQLDLGGIYTMDPSLEHASLNFGETTRIHLVVDLEAAETGVAKALDAPVLV